MADEISRELTLYVQSKKVVTAFYRPPTGSRTSRISPEAGASDVSGRGSGDDNVASGEAFFLSDDQAHCIALTEDLAHRRGYQVKVVDVAKVGRIEEDHLRAVALGLEVPGLIGLGDSRLEGTDAFTEDHLCEMMPAETSHQRAFTYLKVRGGDLDRIQTWLLGFPEVREIHLLTGDWDMFAILEFPGSEEPQAPGP